MDSINQHTYICIISKMESLYNASIYANHYHPQNIMVIINSKIAEGKPKFRKHLSYENHDYSLQTAKMFIITRSHLINLKELEAEKIMKRKHALRYCRYTTKMEQKESDDATILHLSNDGLSCLYSMRFSSFLNICFLKDKIYYVVESILAEIISLGGLPYIYEYGHKSS